MNQQAQEQKTQSVRKEVVSNKTCSRQHLCPSEPQVASRDCWCCHSLVRWGILLRLPNPAGKLLPGDAVLQRPPGGFLEPRVLHQHLHQLTLQLAVIFHDELHKHICCCQGRPDARQSTGGGGSGRDTHLHMVTPVLLCHAFLQRNTCQD